MSNRTMSSITYVDPCVYRMPHNPHYIGADGYCHGRKPVYHNGVPGPTRTMRLLGRG